MRFHVMVLLSVAGASAGAAFGQATFQGLGFVSDMQHSRASGLSYDGGVVVGHVRTSGSSGEAYRWTAATGMVLLGDLGGGGTWSAAADVSADGFVVAGTGTVAYSGSRHCGNLFPCPTGENRAIRIQGTSNPSNLGTLGGERSWSVAAAVSDDGSVVVGNSSVDEIGGAFRWVQSTGMVDLGVLPSAGFSTAADVSGDGRTVVGWCLWPNTGEEAAFVWREGEGMSRLLSEQGAASSSYAQAISGDGRVIAGLLVQNNQAGLFRWTLESGAVELPLVPGAQSVVVYGMNDDGSVIVGMSHFATPDFLFEQRPFIWDEARGTRLLRDELEQRGADLAGWELTLGYPVAISGDGRWVAGTGRNPAGSFEAWLGFLGADGCAADVTGDGGADVFDLLAYLGLWFAGDAGAERTGDGAVDVFDLLAYLDGWFVGC